MINVTVAECKARLNNEEKDLQSLWMVQFSCVCLAFLFVVLGPPLVAVFPIGLSAMVFFIQIHIYRNWKGRLDKLLEATRNIPVDIDF